MKECVVIILLLFQLTTRGQIITTFAGGGTGGLGDGGPATVASLPNPIGGVFDKYGNYYCAEAVGGQRIRKVSNAGIITTIAGNGTSGFSGDNGPATAAELDIPTSVKLDAAGNFYIADANNMRVRKVDAVTGIITTIAGSSSIAGYGGDNGPATAAMLFAPNDLCFDTSGNLYIADEQNYRIRKIDTQGIITTFAGIGIPGYTGDGGPASIARISLISGLTIDDTGNLYIAGGNVVRKINKAGIITTVAGVHGSYIYTGNGVPATNAPINPIKLAIDRFGQLVIADYLNYRVYLINNAGIIHTIAGNGISGFSGDGGHATAASFNYPSGVAFDSCGNLYIAEAGNKRVRKVAFNPPPCDYLSVNEQKTQPGTTVYPNPTTDELHIEGLTNRSEYVLLNVTGITEQRGIVKKGGNTLPVTYLPHGVYMLLITDQDGKRTVHKVVKD